MSKKLTHILAIIAFFLLLMGNLLPISYVSSIKSIQESSAKEGIVINDLVANYEDSIKKYANTLINEAENYSSGGLHWKKFCV